MKRYFITGTDTDCGKTHVTCLLLKYFNNNNYAAQALKPVASGSNGINDDIIRLQHFNADPITPVNRWSFKTPVSPHLAARHENQSLTAAELAAFCNESRYNQFDYLLIEGAGGLMVPLNEQETWLDFIECLSIPVIIVVGIRLGCINQALLTEAVLKQQKAAITGWIANCLDSNMLMLEENIATLKEKLDSPLLATVPYNQDIDWVVNPIPVRPVENAEHWSRRRGTEPQASRQR
ncbi:dethiobiotin synthase [Legionella dresdenensis]|uniref:ATP-dependent dethiobiotin synthetase BioD n=1 Tax=Legionella dresdenensis TaxID=450200 RepID=A0ABV8CB90_9GAMM